MLNDAKQQYIDATVVVSDKHKNGAQTGRPKQKSYVQIAQCWKLIVTLSTFNVFYKVAKVQLF